jgi:hypothetical protein
MSVKLLLIVFVTCSGPPKRTGPSGQQLPLPMDALVKVVARLSGYVAAGEMFRKMGNGRILKNVSDRYVASQRLLQSRMYFDQLQRISAKVEEAVMYSDSRKSENLAPDTSDGFFGKASRIGGSADLRTNFL